MRAEAIALGSHGVLARRNIVYREGSGAVSHRAELRRLVPEIVESDGERGVSGRKSLRCCGNRKTSLQPTAAHASMWCRRLRERVGFARVEVPSTKGAEM